MLLFGLLLFNKVTVNHLCLIYVFPPSRILLLVVSILSLYSVHLLLKTANEGGMAKYYFISMVFVLHYFLWNNTVAIVCFDVFSFRIFIIWTVGNEGIWYAWKTCCFWINYNAEHWRWGRDLKMTLLSVIIIPYLLWRLFFFTQHVFINCLCSSEVMKHVMWFLHLVTYSVFVMIYDVIHLQLCQATSS